MTEILSFSDWLISLSIGSPCPYTLSQKVKISFLCPSSIPLCKRPIVVLSIHSSTEGRLGCFHILASIDKAAGNIGVLMFSSTSVSGFFRYIPRSGITCS